MQHFLGSLLQHRLELAVARLAVILDLTKVGENGQESVRRVSAVSGAVSGTVPANACSTPSRMMLSIRSYLSSKWA